MSVCVCAYYAVDVRGQLVGVSFLLLPRGCQGLNSGPQAPQPVPLPTEPSASPVLWFLLLLLISHLLIYSNTVTSLFLSPQSLNLHVSSGSYWFLTTSALNVRCDGSGGKMRKKDCTSERIACTFPHCIH